MIELSTGSEVFTGFCPAILHLGVFSLLVSPRKRLPRPGLVFHRRLLRFVTTSPLLPSRVFRASSVAMADVSRWDLWCCAALATLSAVLGYFGRESFSIRSLSFMLRCPPLRSFFYFLTRYFGSYCGLLSPPESLVADSASDSTFSITTYSLSPL